jgi:tRNA A-37 threonylcarbamoyl transferase component Bud32
VGEPIARGGQATVHRATHVSLGREAAIKVFHPHVWDDPAFRARFRRECEALVALEHPNVIPVLDAGEADTGWIVMHLATGGSLDDRLAAGPLQPDEALRVLRQVAAALDAAHAVGRLHRDVKPANVLLEPDGHAWLADFGVARAVGTTTTVPGQMIGTAAYMAPEVISGERARPPADLYAFACMAFEVLTSRRPFPDAEVGTVLFAHLERTPPRARAINPHIPKRAERVLAQALSKDPRDRPRSAGALVQALSAAFPAPDATRPYPASVVAPHDPRRGRVRGIAALAVAATVLVGGAIGGYALLGPGGTVATAPAEQVPLPPVPTPGGEVTGREAPAGAVPGARPTDRVAATTIDGATAYAINAGPGRSPAAVAAAISARLADSGLLVDRLDVSGDGSIALAHAVTDVLLRGDTWAIAQVPGARAADPDRVLVIRGTDGTPARTAEALSDARPASLLAPG